MKIKKMFIFFVALTTIFLLTACRIPTEDVVITHIEIDQNTIEETYVIEEFDLSKIGLFIYKSDNTTEYTFLNETMIVEDLTKLNTVGNYTLTVQYQSHQTALVITIIFDSLNQKLHAIYTMGVNEGVIETDYQSWLDSIQGEEGIGIHTIYINTQGELIIELTDETLFNLGPIIGQQGIGIQDVEINANNELIITLTDNSTINAGEILVEDGISIVSVEKNAEGELILTFSDDSTQNIGNVIGETGTGIETVTINNDQELIITFTDGTVHNLGNVAGEAARDIELALIDDKLVWRYTDNTEWQLLSDLTHLTPESVTTLLEALLNEYTDSLDLFELFSDIIDQETLSKYELHHFDESLISMLETARKSIVMIFNYNEDETGSLGSGVIYKQEGNTYYVVTNHHVIEEAFELGVRFSLFGNYFDIAHDDITVLGSDPLNDIAVITFESSFELSVAPIYQGYNLNIGQRVYAIGHPYGFIHFSSASEGIISGLNRDVVFNGIDTLAIQHDAAINPGNSGGALFNVHGELIGINFAKIVGEEYEGLGYAVPISAVLKIIDDIERVGQLQRVLLGIQVNTLNPADCNVIIGVCILEAPPSGAAFQAGLQDLDIITGIKYQEDTDFMPINNFKDLRLFLLSTTKNQAIQVQYVRDDLTYQTTPFTLNVHPDDIVED